MRGCDGRPQDNTSNLSRPRAWIEMNSSALSPTLMWPCLERIGVTMDCLNLEIEDQSCLVGGVDQGLMKNRQIDLLDRMTKKRAKKKTYVILSHSDVTRNISASNPKNKFGKKLAKLPAFHCHRSHVLLFQVSHAACKYSGRKSSISRLRQFYFICKNKKTCNHMLNIRSATKKASCSC